MTWSHKHAQRRMHHSPEAECLSSGPLDMSADELKQLLKSDPSLKKLKITGMDHTDRRTCRKIHKTLKAIKAMLKKVAVEAMKNWDKWLPFLLFAY